MRKRVQIALVVGLVALAGVIEWMLHSQEPVYQGKPLSFWLKSRRMAVGKINGVYYMGFREGADEAVRQAGTNAIPTLLRLLRAKDSALKAKMLSLARRQRVIKIEYTPAEVWCIGARYGFSVLGAKAQSSVPALIEIANQNLSAASRCCAIDALGLIGPPAKDAVPSLLGWATNADWQVRCNAILALGRIRAEPERVLPVLTNALHDPAAEVHPNAVKALLEFGPNAKPAVPALVGFLNADDHSMDRSIVTNALKAIDPEAAAKAGVK
jgi:HEAT repeat protein